MTAIGIRQLVEGRVEVEGKEGGVEVGIQECGQLCTAPLKRRFWGWARCWVAMAKAKAKALLLSRQKDVLQKFFLLMA